MKLRRAFFLLAALAALGPAAGSLLAETPTDAKIRLMSEALAARDKGDYATARLKLEAVLTLAPNDAGVRRMMGELETRQAADEAARIAQQRAAVVVTPPPEVAPVIAPPIAPAGQIPSAAPNTPPPTTSNDAATATLMTVPVITEGRPSPPPPSNLPDGYAAALARVESAGVAFAHTEGPARLEKLMVYVQAQRDLARLYARDGNFPLAMSTLDAAMASLKTSMGELRTEREDYARQEEIQKEGVRLRHHR